MRRKDGRVFPAQLFPRRRIPVGWEGSTLSFVLPAAFLLFWDPFLSLFPQPEQSHAVTREGFTARSKFDLFPQMLY